MIERLVVGACVVLGAAGGASAQCLETLAVPRGGAAATSLQGRVFVAGGGGSGVVEMRDPATGAWSRASLSAARDNLAAVSNGAWAFFGGGGLLSGTFQVNHSNVVDVYDPSTEQWSVTAFSEPRSALAAVNVLGQVVFAGGWVSSTPPLAATATVDTFDFASGWNVASLSAPRYALAGTAVGTKGLFGGGADAGVVSDVVDVYDLTMLQPWSTTTLSVARSHLAATTVGTLAIFAGGFDGVGPSDAVDIYDDFTGQWSTAQLSVARFNLAAASAGTLAIFAGGETMAGESDVVDVYDTVRGRWFTTTLPTSRRSMAAASTGEEAFFTAGLAGNLVSGRVEVFSSGMPVPFGGGGVCPCGNPGSSISGCAGSSGMGAVLSADGCPQSAVLSFEVQGLVPLEPAVLFRSSGTPGTRLVLGDGLLRMTGPYERVLGTLSDASGRASFAAPMSGTGVQAFQVWYRDPMGPCGSGFNLSSAVRLRRDL